MALQAHIEANFLGAVGGEVHFSLDVPVVNPVLGEIIEALYIGEVDNTGHMELDLPINGDPDLVPQGSKWRVKHRLLPAGSRRAEYDIVLSLADAGQTINLATLIAM